MTLTMDTGRGGGVQGPMSLFEDLAESVDEWLDELGRNEPPVHGPALLVLEHFEGLQARARWLEERARTEFGLDAFRFEAIVALSGLQVAATRSVVSTAEGPAPPEEVVAAFLDLWRPCLVRCPGVTAAQVAVASLGCGWSPLRGSRSVAPPWEPARLGLLSMTHKAVKNGVHFLANISVPPLVRERCEERCSFDHRVQAMAQSIALSLVSPRPGGPGRAIAEWDCGSSTLWGFLFDAVLGPGHAGGGSLGGRPQAGAYAKSLFGRWLEPRVGITVKTVEQYYCASCQEAHPDPKCPVSGDAVVMETSSRNRYVTPRDRLCPRDREWGHEEVRRRICKNPDCRDALHRLMTACGRRPGADPQPLYDCRLGRCPYCGAAPTRFQKTVWTRHP